MLLACPMVYGASADEQPPITEGYQEVVSSEEKPAFHWDLEVEGYVGEEDVKQKELIFWRALRKE